ncbi:PQQ-like domain-containing protein [Elsinoe fawcettii]|nr:PQQ-like domain-containing protein [Elsinoe fawcettii]
MDLLWSSSIPDSTSEVAVGRLSCTDKYVGMVLSDGTVHIFSAINGSLKVKVNHPCRLTSWAHVIAGDQLFVGSGDGILRCWDINTGQSISETSQPDVVAFEIKEPDKSKINPASIRTLRLLDQDADPSHVSLLVADRSGTIHRWQSDTSSYTNHFLDAHQHVVFDIQLYRNGSRFVSASWEGRIAAWAAGNGAPLWKRTLSLHMFSFTIANDKIVVAGMDGEAQVLSLDDGNEISRFDIGGKVVNSLMFSNNVLISTDIEGYAKLWSFSATDIVPQLIRSEGLFDHAVTARCLLGDYLVAGGKDGGPADDACGIDARLMLWKVGGGAPQNPTQIGARTTVVWSILKLDCSSVAVSLTRRGMPTVEVWRLSETT